MRPRSSRCIFMAPSLNKLKKHIKNTNTMTDYVVARVVPVLPPPVYQPITHKPQTVDELEQIQGVTRLYLSDTTVSDEDAERLAECVKKSKVLVWLYLNRTVISANAVGILMKALATSKSVEIVDLIYIQLDDEGANHISDALMVNRSIEMLLLIGNSITDAGGRRLLGSISANTTLRWINLGETAISSGIVDDIYDVFSRNGDIVHIRPFVASPPYIAPHRAIACHDLSRDQLDEVLSRATKTKSLYIYGTKFE